jgi:hypothetical protein
MNGPVMTAIASYPGLREVRLRTTKWRRQGDTLALIGLVEHFYDSFPAGVGALAGNTAEANYSASTPSFAANASFDGNLSNIFAQGEMGLSGWINGAILFIDALTTLLESDLVNGLPFVEDIDLSSDGFLADLRGALVTLQTAAATTLGQVQTELNTALGDASKSLDGSVSFSINGTAATAAQLALTMDQLFGVIFDANPSNDISSFVVDLGLTGLFQKSIDFGELDLGFGPIELGGTGGLDLAASFGLNLGLGYSPTQGFYVQGTSNPAAAALRYSSRGKDSASSQAAACGAISSRTKRRTVSRKAACSAPKYGEGTEFAW